MAVSLRGGFVWVEGGVCSLLPTSRTRPFWSCDEEKVGSGQWAEKKKPPAPDTAAEGLPSSLPTAHCPLPTFQRLASPHNGYVSRTLFSMLFTICRNDASVTLILLYTGSSRRMPPSPAP